MRCCIAAWGLRFNLPFKDHSCCWVMHTQRDVGLDLVLAACIGIMKSIFFKRKTANEQNWSKLAASWTCIDMICYDVLWCAMICDMISSVWSIDLWNFGGLSFWAGGQCGKNSPDNLDFHAESLWQQSSCHQDRAQHITARPKWCDVFSTLALLLYAQTFLTCRRSNQDVDDAKKWRLQVEPNDNCCELNRCLKVYYGVQTCYRFVLIQHVLYTARIKNDIILIHCQYNMR